MPKNLVLSRSAALTAFAEAERALIADPSHANDVAFANAEHDLIVARGFNAEPCHCH